MRSGPTISILCLVLVAAGTLWPVLASPADAATEAIPEARPEVTKRDLRDARAALEEGQWQAAAGVYELALQSTLAIDPEIRVESLYITTLALLTAPDATHIDTATERLAALQSIRTNPHQLEVAALRALLDSLETEKGSVLNLRQELTTKSKVCREELAARDLAAVLREQEAERLRKRNRVIARKLEDRREHLRELSRELETRKAELAQYEVDVDFLTSQLAGTQQDQTQMLDAVVNKNTELRKKERELGALRLALDRQKQELEAQAEELSLKEEEIRRREEAIREVTERILQKDPNDS
jgi:hypothetical protein